MNAIDKIPVLYLSYFIIELRDNFNTFIEKSSACTNCIIKKV